MVVFYAKGQHFRWSVGAARLQSRICLEANKFPVFGCFDMKLDTSISPANIPVGPPTAASWQRFRLGTPATSA